MPVVAIIVLEAFLDPVTSISVREQGPRGASVKCEAWEQALEEDQETGSKGPHGHKRLWVNLDPEGDFMVSAKTVLQSPRQQLSSTKYIRIKVYVLLIP